MKKLNYYVIGGQYDYLCYGGAPTLTGAKRLANKSAEHWDNYRGWHIPKIYRAEDVQECNNFFGAGYCPKYGAEPVATAYYSNSGRIVWEKTHHV